MHIQNSDDYIEMLARFQSLTDAERLWVTELNILLDKGFSEDEQRAYDLAMTKLEATLSNHKEK